MFDHFIKYVTTGNYNEVLLDIVRHSKNFKDAPVPGGILLTFYHSMLLSGL